MTVYLVFRVMTGNLEFHGRTSAKSSKKAVQKFLDQRPYPHDAEKVSGTANADWVAVPENNFNRYRTTGRRK